MASVYGIESFTIVDRYGTKKPTQLPVSIADSQTLAQLVTDWGATGTVLDGVTDGQIVGGHILIPRQPLGGWGSSPGASSFVERNGNFNFNDNTTKYKFPISVPSFDQALEAAGKIDLTNAAVAAFVSLITGGFTGGTFVNTGYHVLTALADAFLSTRKSRKQLDRSTYELGG